MEKKSTSVFQALYFKVVEAGILPANKYQERARGPFHKTTKLQNYKTTKLQNY
ncbi:MAG: hypothetical protein F6K39_27125 [Okeania sp. SIO3B3]|nr:hypothetical protein [Okeania sp. SIO3B3]